jgi:hypothetical protein
LASLLPSVLLVIGQGEEAPAPALERPDNPAFPVASVRHENFIKT